MSKRAALSALAAGAIAVGTAAGTGATAAAATAPSLTVTNPQRCFLNTFTSNRRGVVNERYAVVDVRGAGWSPGARVQVDFDGITDEVQKRAKADGTFTATFTLPDPDLGYESSPTYQSFPVIAIDFGAGNASDLGGSIAESQTINFTDRSVNLWEDQGDVYGQNSLFHPSDPVLFKASGFTPGKHVYAHYLFNGTRYTHPGKRIATIDLGKASGPCGTVDHRATILPTSVADTSVGDYTIAFSPSRGYSTRTNQYSWLFHL
jgi:hypothetical protein